MPSFDQQVTNDVNDTYNYNGVADNNYGQVYISHDSNQHTGGWRFTNVTIPASSIITVCYLRVRHYLSTRKALNTTLYFEDVDDASVLEGGTVLNNRDFTDNSVAWVETLTSDTWHNSPSLVDPCQEVIDRDGWASGQDMVVIGYSAVIAGRCWFYDYQASPANAGRIHIEYIEGNPFGPKIQIV